MTLHSCLLVKGKNAWCHGRVNKLGEPSFQHWAFTYAFLTREPFTGKARLWFAHSDFCLHILHWLITCKCMHSVACTKVWKSFLWFQRRERENSNHTTTTLPCSPSPSSLLSTNFNSSLLILLKPTLECYSLDWCYPMPFLSGFHCAIQSIQGSHCRLLVPMIASDMYSWKDSYSKNDLLF